MQSAMLGCDPPAGYVVTKDKRTLPPCIVCKQRASETQWVTSRCVTKGETLWSERLFVFGVSAEGSSVALSEDTEWNHLASSIWKAMVSKGGDKTRIWAIGFSAVVRALSVLTNRPKGAVLSVVPLPTSPKEDAVPISLAALLVKAFSKLRGYKPMEPLPAAWFLISAQRSSIPLREPLPSNTVKLNAFMTLLHMVARVPLRKAANAVLSVTISSETQEVEIRCTALKPIPEGMQVRLHIGRCLISSVVVGDDSISAWNTFCEAMEAKLLAPFMNCQ